jgi:hypothetical protein
MMAIVLRLLGDERSAIGTRHAAMASIFASVSVVAGIFLTIAGSNLYEQSSQRVIWALATGAGPLAA